MSTTNARLHVIDENGNMYNVHQQSSISDVEGLQAALAGKVDKETGKGLSSNDYTAAEKSKLASIETGATKVVVDSELNIYSTNTIQNKEVYKALAKKADAEKINEIDWRIGNSKTILSERIFRDVVHHVNGVQTNPCQCVAYADNTFVVAGHIYNNEKQKINVYSVNGVLIREQEFEDADLYHLNGIAYDPESNELYTAGVNNKIVVIDYTSLTVKRRLTIEDVAYAISFYNGKLYVLSNGGRNLRIISEVNVTTGELTEVCTFQLSSEERILQLVEQDMTVINDIAYICCNQNNIIIAIKLETGELFQSYSFDVGDGLFPYGELESATNVNGQLYFLSVIWNTERECWISQIFKSNIGGNITPCALSGQNARQSQVIYIDSNSNLNNPIGTQTSPFKTLVEASAYVSYHSNDLNTSTQIHVVTNSSFESDDALSLYKASATINMNAVRCPNVYLRDGVYSVINSVADFEIRNSVVKIYASTIRSITQFYGILAIGKFTYFLPNTQINLIGVTLMPFKLSDVNRMNLENCEIITNNETEDYSVTPTIAWKSGAAVTFDVYDCNVAVKNGSAKLYIRVNVSDWGNPAENDFIEVGGFDSFPLNFDNNNRPTRIYGNIYINGGIPSKYVLRIQEDQKSFLITSSSGDYVTREDLNNGILVINADIPVSYIPLTNE